MRSKTTARGAVPSRDVFSHMWTGDGAEVPDLEADLDGCVHIAAADDSLEVSIDDGAVLHVFNGDVQASHYLLRVVRNPFEVDYNQAADAHDMDYEDVIFFVVIDRDEDRIELCGVAGTMTTDVEFLTRLRAQLMLWKLRGPKALQVKMLCEVIEKREQSMSEPRTTTTPVALS